MTARASGWTRQWIAGGLSLLLMGGALGLMAPSASADSAPLDPTSPKSPVTVTADALPTVQINGVAWSQAVVGNTVYVAGKFTTARPAGAAAGTRETVRNNMLAYDIRTGELITSFAPDLNGQALAVAASPDGRRVYVGGDFTRANGEVRNRIAAYDTATGQLVAGFAPSVAGQIRTIAATNDKVYFGGNLTAVGSVSRTRLAAVSAANGALLPWAPVPGASATNGSNEVLAMVLTGGGSQVVVGGRFASLNGTASTGVGALDATTGATKPFAVNKLVTNQGTGSAIWGLSTDGQNVYGSAYDFKGTGNIEGTFAAAAEGGALRFIAHCFGDNYSNYVTGGALYIASHMHNCKSIGGWADSAPAQIWKHATAFSLTGDRKVNGTSRNANFQGAPAPELLNWYPTLTQGSITGQYQAGWNVTGNDRYVVYAGEFPRVNGVGQQGLVRFTMPSQAPNKVGPLATGMEPTVTSVGDGAVRVSWKATSDMDNENLTYRVYRDSDTVAPIHTVTRASQWWNLPTIAVGDTGLTAGSHRYRITATDPFGNVAGSGWTTATVATGGTARPYADVVRADGATSHWSLGEATGTIAYNLAGTTDLTRGNAVTQGAAGALSGDANTSYTFRNDSTSFASTRTAEAGPQTFTAEAWFKTSSKTGGRILGFGNSTSSTASSQHDRLVYLDRQGRVNFGVWPGSVQVLTSPTAYNNDTWHHVAASLSAKGMVLYVDGKQVAARTDVTSAEAFNGYWRVGADNVWGDGARTFTGSIDEVAIYPTALPADRVAAHFAVARTGTAANVAPVADFSTAVTHLDASFDATRSTDADGTIASYAWTFGDGTSGTGATATHAYKTAGTYQVQLTVTDDDGATSRKTGTVTVTAPPPNVAPTADFTVAGAGRTGSFDASASTDSDGTIAAYSWQFGDGLTATGAKVSHEYAKDGTYTVRLTVTDDDGATTSTERGITVSSAVLASDAFERSVTGGLGTADAGGPWTSWAGAVRQSVTGGAAKLALTPGTNTGSYLGTLGQTNADVRTSFTLATVPTGGGVMVYVNPRQADAYLSYKTRLRVLADGSVRAGVLRQTTSGDEALIGAEVLVPGITYTPGMEIAVRAQASGSGTTELALTVWAAGGAEPATPTLTRTDATPALQTPGGVGLSGYLSGSAAAVDLRFADLRVAPVGAAPVTPPPVDPPANAAPTAAFTSAVDGLTAAVDASGSTDPDGTITSYSWAFGDGSATTGVRATHQYAAAGTYTVRLTVTDDDGATATREQTVTVTAPEQPGEPEVPVEALARDAFERLVNGGLGTADVGGAWTSWSGAVRQSVAEGTAKLALTPGTNTGSYLGALRETSTDLRTTLSLSAVPTGGGAQIYVGARDVEVYQAYKARVRVLADGSVRVGMVRLAGNSSDALIGAEVLVPGLTYTPGKQLDVRVQASGTGTTQLALTVWATGTPEPATPTLTRTDSTATLQAPGGVSLSGYLTGSATAPVDVRFDNLRVTAAQ